MDGVASKENYIQWYMIGYSENKLPWKNIGRGQSNQSHYRICPYYNSLPPSNFAQWKSGVQKIWKFLAGTVTFRFLVQTFHIANSLIFINWNIYFEISKIDKPENTLLWTEFESGKLTIFAFLLLVYVADRCFNSQFVSTADCAFHKCGVAGPFILTIYMMTCSKQ
jgi:hypothetical protein